MPSRGLLLSSGLFTVTCVLLALLAVFGASYLFGVAEKPKLLPEKAGEALLLVATVALIGAAVKQIADARSEKIRRLEADAARRTEFLRRVRELHVTVRLAQDLMIAHRTPKTWTEQCRELIKLIAVAEEISEDLKVQPHLFTRHEDIVAGVEGIVRYLERCRDEYVASHDYITSEWEQGDTIDPTVVDHEMLWTRGFLERGGSYKAVYDASLRAVKTSMRPEVFPS